MGEQPIDGVSQDWIDTTRAAALAGYDEEYLRQMARAGKLETRKVGRAWLFSREGLLQHKAKMDALGNKRHDPRRNPQLAI